jgi:hypothetical protein
MHMSALKGTSGDFITYQKRIVRPWCVDNGGREAKIIAGKIQICSLDDIRVNLFLLGPCVAQIGGDVSLQELSR